MGSALAGRLLGQGRQVSVWNRTPGKARALESAGATVAASATALASHSDVVITIVTDAAAIHGIYDGLLAGDVRGKLFIEMSTVRPEAQEALNDKVRAKGAA